MNHEKKYFDILQRTEIFYYLPSKIRGKEKKSPLTENISLIISLNKYLDKHRYC